jgi:folate-binding protein YgfZ
MADTAQPDRPARTVEVEQALQGGALVVLTRRDVIVVSGPDAVEFLQGQLSQDVAGLAVGASAPSLLLQPQGKIDAWTRVTRVADDCVWLDLDAGYGEAAQARLRRFKLRVDCELAGATVVMVAIRGPAAGEGPAGLGMEVPPELLVLDAAWPSVAGFDLLAAPDVGSSGVEAVVAGLGERSDVVVGTEDELEALRVRVGVPAMGRELDEGTIPAAAGIVDTSVDFTKGCYVGQELVARVDSRGSNTPTRLYGLRFDGVDGAGSTGSRDPSPGDSVVVDGVEVGRVTSYAPVTGEGPVGLAYIKRGTAVPGPAVVTSAGGATLPVIVVQLPAPLAQGPR